MPRNALAADAVRIAVRAAGVNFPDYLLTKGEYHLRLQPPFTPGMEVAGVVTETGSSVHEIKVGAQVVAMTRFGGFAEEVAVAKDTVFPLPPSFSFDEGACFLVAARTAYHALVDRGGLQRGETALVLGATGGVGMAAVQLAKHLGANVIAIGSNDVKLACAQAAGAQHTINYRETDLVEGVRKLVRTVDIVFDPVGGDRAIQAARLLGWGGRFLVVGFASGVIPSFSANYALLKGYSIVGVRAGESGGCPALC
jgi:NADPH2:quinone reductase